MNDRQRNNVEKLINDINDDLVANKQEIINLEQQINDVDNSYTTLIAQNRKNESKTQEYSLLYKKLVIDEKSIQNQFDS